MWERRMELEGFEAVMETVRNKIPGLKGRAIAGPHDYEQIPALIERGCQRIADFYVDLEAQLGQAPFVAGDRLSAADITAVVTVDFATKALDLAIPDANIATRRWHSVIAARASFPRLSGRRQPAERRAASIEPAPLLPKVRRRSRRRIPRGCTRMLQGAK
jgi:glutathione S-transferase